VVDRTVAQVGSAALARAVRARGLRFVAVSCHEDVEDWLQPDWVYRPATNIFTRRSLQRRPAIELAIARVERAAWRLFRAHHYLSGSLAPSAVCFQATWRGRPVAFSAWIPCLARRRGKREHRTVTLPDYQGVGIGHRLSGFCAALWTALGYRAGSTTTHPAFIAARLRSPDWRLLRAPSLARGHRGTIRHATTRLTAGFEYVGPPLDAGLARRVLAAGTWKTTVGKRPCIDSP
jgi:GNAT superfamily N-acetyltransferase